MSLTISAHRGQSLCQYPAIIISSHTQAEQATRSEGIKKPTTMTTSPLLTKEDSHDILNQVFGLGEQIAELRGDLRAKMGSLHDQISRLQTELKSFQKGEACLRDIAARANVLLRQYCVEMLSEKNGRLSELLECMHLAERTVEHLARGLQVVATEEAAEDTAIAPDEEDLIDLSNLPVSDPVITKRAAFNADPTATVQTHTIHAAVDRTPADRYTPPNLAGTGNSTFTADVEPLVNLDEDDQDSDGDSASIVAATTLSDPFV
ncbi:hypothetical protein IWZ01DRAFT_478488 [Phyllosticta capitalensis]